MQYQLAFSYFYAKQPNGLSNLLLVTLCLFIPVVGPLVVLGYQAEVTERLSRDPDLRRYPDFTFDRFAEFLSRGLWPFLVSLVVALMAVPVLIVAVLAAGAVGAAVDPIIALVLAFLIYLGGILTLTAVVIPIQFHAEMTDRFDLGGGFRFAVSFLKLVGGKAVVTYIVFNLITIPLTLVGLLACGIGVFPAAVVSIMAGQHLMVQLYLDYLDLGGEELVSTPSKAELRRQWRDEDDDRPHRQRDEDDDRHHRRRDEDDDRYYYDEDRS